jgi:tetratricopeptide (TPR) repeat protein
MAADRDEALRLLEEGNRLHREGNIDGAIDCYRRSIEAHPTGDALTYLGWMLSFKGEIDEAISHCKRAIEVDPDFGNPYNDIGVYLMQQGKLDEAEPWFRRATTASRYEPRHFPHVNLGRLYIARRSFADAIRELRAAMEKAPGDPTAPHLLQELASRLNGSFGTYAFGSTFESRSGDEGE